MGAEARLGELHIELPDGMPPVGNYVAAVRTGDLLFLAGHRPVRVDGTMVTGKVGVDLDLATARDAARLVALNLLTTVRRELGSLDAVGRIVKVLGMVRRRSSMDAPMCSSRSSVRTSVVTRAPPSGWQSCHSTLRPRTR